MKLIPGATRTAMGLGSIALTVILTACGSSGLSAQEQELQARSFTNIVTQEDGPSYGIYGVSVDKCRFQMVWSERNGWTRMPGKKDEVTAEMIRDMPEFDRCTKKGEPAPSSQMQAPTQ